MNSKISIVLFCLVIAFAACKKPPIPQKKDIENQGETGNENNEPSKYAGEWDYSKIEMTDGELSAQGQTLGSFEGIGKDIVGNVVVTENPNRFTAELEYTAALTLSIFGQSIPRDMPVEKRVISGDWTEVNGQIVLDPDDGSEIEVLSSSANKVVFVGVFTEKIALGQQFNFDAISDVEITIEK